MCFLMIIFTFLQIRINFKLVYNQIVLFLAEDAYFFIKFVKFVLYHRDFVSYKQVIFININGHFESGLQVLSLISGSLLYKVKFWLRKKWINLYKDVHI